MTFTLIDDIPTAREFVDRIAVGVLSFHVLSPGRARRRLGGCEPMLWSGRWAWLSPSAVPVPAGVGVLTFHLISTEASSPRPESRIGVLWSSVTT